MYAPNLYTHAKRVFFFLNGSLVENIIILILEDKIMYFLGCDYQHSYVSGCHLLVSYF